MIAIFQLLILFTYLLYTVKTVGVAYSISNTYYKWKEVKRSQLFIWFLGLIMLSMLIAAELINWSHAWTWLAFVLGSFSVWCVGIYAAFKNSKSENAGHNIASVIAFSLPLISVAFEGFYYSISLFIAAAGLMLACPMENRTWWIETIGILCLIMGVHAIS